MSERADFLTARREFEEKLEFARNPIFGTLSEERRQKILSGQEIYIEGARRVVRQAGLDVDHYNAVYALLSSHAHSTPASFYRSAVMPKDPHPGIPPDVQYAVSWVAFDYATGPLGFACERMFDLYPELFKKNNQSTH